MFMFEKKENSWRKHFEKGNECNDAKTRPMSASFRC